MQIYSYSKCSTCRKAIKWLNSNDFDYELIDIIENPPDRDLLVAAAKQLGDRKYLFNTSGISYRKLGSKVVKAFSDDEAFQSLVKDPKLIKRPFLVVDSEIFLVGFNESTWTSSLLK